MSSTLIYERIPKLMDAIGAISKSRKNQGQGYKFRGVDDALNAMHAPMIDLGLCCSVKCHSVHNEANIEKGKEKDRYIYHTTLLMDVSFIAADGSCITHTGAGEGIDIASDKATNKAMAAAFKYAVFLGLCIPVEDDTLADSDAASPKPDKSDAAPVAPTIPALPSLPAITGPAPDAGPKVCETVQKQIVELVQRLDIPPEVISQMWAKYGVQYLYDLPVKAGDEVLAKFKKLDLEQQAKQVF